MRGDDPRHESMFSYITPEARVRPDHPLRPIRRMTDAALARLSSRFDQLYSSLGRPSIPPEQLLRALLLQMLYSIRSERLLIEELESAPRAEQVATAELLRDAAAVDAYGREFHAQLQARLDRLHQAFSAMHAAGLPVRDISPQGAIYLSVQFDLAGRRGLPTNDDVRSYLLREAGFAVVPFQAFGLEGETGWFRLSVGAVSLRDIDEALPRVEAALRRAMQSPPTGQR